MTAPRARIVAVLGIVLAIATRADVAIAGDLVVAARDGDAATVRALLTRHGDPNERDAGGRTALMWAALNGHVATVRVLLDAGADANAVSPTGDTALMAAALKGRDAVVRILLQHGVDTNHRNKAGATAVDFAVERGHFEIADMIERRPQRPR